MKIKNKRLHIDNVHKIVKLAILLVTIVYLHMDVTCTVRFKPIKILSQWQIHLKTLA